MRPTNTSDTSARHQSVINEPSSQDDTMLMGFEFFDEKGHLNPRKILFSAQTSPSRANSIVTTLFGKVMQWGACRWAENFLKHAQTSQDASTEHTKLKISDLITDIRKSGTVKMTEFFKVSMPVIIERERRKHSPATDANLKNKKGTTFQSGPSLINSADIIQHYNSALSPKKISQKYTLIQLPEVKKNESIKPIIDTLINYQKIFSATGRPENKTTQYITSLFKSGFLEYCQYGPTALRNIDIDNLEKFLKDYRNEWRTLKNVLNADQLIQLNEQRTKIIADISNYKKLNPEHKGKAAEEKHRSITSEEIIDAKTLLQYNDVPGLFRRQLDVDYQDLNQVDWESDGLYLQINDEDALKIRQYFFTAPLNEENFQLAKKIYPLLRKIQLTYLANVPAITQLDVSTELQNPGSILSSTFEAFFKRYALKTTSDKPSASVVKKSKNKKNRPKQAKRAEKNRKKKLDDGTELLQSARKQPDEANAPIERVNKKTTTSPKKINKNFL